MIVDCCGSQKAGLSQPANKEGVGGLDGGQRRMDEAECYEG
jgi:hypothetical protein